MLDRYVVLTGITPMAIKKVETSVQYYFHASRHFHDMVHTNKDTFIEISGSHNSKYEDDCLLGCCAILSHRPDD
jgi:hypothetical protein